MGNIPLEQVDKAKQRIEHWRRSPLAFAQEAFKFKPSNQQKEFYIELGNLVNAKMKVDLELPLNRQEKIYASKRGISIRSGKGTGKDAAVSIAIFWFLMLFQESRNYLVAPSLDAIKANLISEMNKWKTRRVNGEHVCLVHNEFDLMSAGCRMSNDEENGKSWFVKSMSAGPNLPEDKQLETLQGKHARFQMFVIDEASGVPDPVFSPLDTTLTDPVNFIIMIFNPTRRSGFAHASHFEAEKKYWIPLHWNAEESSMVSPDQIAYLKDKYGEASTEYRVSVLGEPPLAEDGSLIPYDWCIAAKDLIFEPLDDDPVVFGVDVANMGSDSTVILVRRGHSVVEITEYKKLDTNEVAEAVAMRAAEWRPNAIYIDVCGLGVGVYDNLRRLGVPNVRGINTGRSAKRPQKFMRLRDEIWWATRKAFQENRISLNKVSEDRGLISELSSIRYKINDKSKVKVEGKADLRQRKMPSPNKADALTLTYVADITALRQGKEQERQHRKKKTIHSQGYNTNADTLNWLNC